MKEILVFGAGTYYKRNIHLVEMLGTVIGVLDNNERLWDTQIDSHPIISPSRINSIKHDMIVVLCAQYDQVRQQLLLLGEREDKVISLSELLGKHLDGVSKTYLPSGIVSSTGKKVLIINNNLSHDGVTIVAMHAATVLQGLGYDVTVGSPIGEPGIINELCNYYRIPIVHYPSLIDLSEKVMAWIMQFDVILINMFCMIKHASELSKYKPVIWWIHEPGDAFSNHYRNTALKYKEYICRDKIKDVHVYAVSNIAKRNFEKYIEGCTVELLPYGLPDINKSTLCMKTKTKDKIIFVIVGAICERKAQLIFIEAANQICKMGNRDAEFWIVGKMQNNEYSREVQNLIAQNPRIHLKGELTREQMDSMYQMVDVVVCPSMEDPLPVVMTEGMMFNKPCIASEQTGTACYIEDGRNGFVVEAGDADDLAQKMQWFINNKHSIQEMGANARKVYDHHFSLEKFGDALETIIQEVL